MTNKTIICILLAVSILGAGAIGLVWLRMENSAIAKECGELEDELEIVAREVHELRAQYSRSMRPSTLASMVSGRLRMPDARMTFHVSLEDMERRLSSGDNASGVRKFHTQGEFARTQ